jgi:site-specific DNA-methyltransferase (adenine-specific)
MTSDVQFITADATDLDLAAFASFDTMIVDPPYSAHVHENAVSANKAGLGFVSRDLGFASLTPELRVFVARVAKRVRRWSVIFADHEGAHLWREACEAKVIDGKALDDVRTVPWIRWSQPQKSGDRPGSQSEAVLHFHPAGRKKWTGPGWLMAYGLDQAGARIRRSLRGEDKHPTEKPLDLMLDLVSWHSDPGESVVDPLAGSGTTALAALLLGRDCLAIERDERWSHVFDVRRKALAGRDRLRAEEWCNTTFAEAEADLAKPRTKDSATGKFTDENTRARASHRIADVGRVAQWL